MKRAKGRDCPRVSVASPVPAPKRRDWLTPQRGTRDPCPLFLRANQDLCPFYFFFRSLFECIWVLAVPYTWFEHVNHCLVWIPVWCLIWQESSVIKQLPNNLSWLIQTWIILFSLLFNYWATGQISFSKGLVRDGFSCPFYESRCWTKGTTLNVGIYSAHNAHLSSLSLSVFQFTKGTRTSLDCSPVPFTANISYKIVF